MEELQIGKITSQELASWFGIAYTTYRKKASSLLKELNYFCIYEKFYGGVDIKEIFIKKYVKNLFSKDSEVYLQLVKESDNYLCSVAGMVRKLKTLYPKEWGQYGDSQLQQRLRKAGIALFGQTNLPIYRLDQEERYCGPKGYKEYCWAIKVSNLNEYRFLTEEENKIFDGLIESYNISKQQVVERIEYNKEKLKELKEKQITTEEYILAVEQYIDLFPNLLSKFKEATGKTLVRATRHEIMESVF